MRYRQDTVSFMRQHRDDFEPFMEDGEDFERYCCRMAQVRTSLLLLIVCKACPVQVVLLPMSTVADRRPLTCFIQCRTAHGQGNRSRLLLHVTMAS